MVLAVVQCDVREETRKGREPLNKVMWSVSCLGPQDTLELLSYSEPVHLYWVLGKRGFTHRTERSADGTWRVVFFRQQRH